MSHGFQREPHRAQWRSFRILELFISATVWLFCATFIWAGVRAWLAGAGVAMMIVALGLCAAAALVMPHLRRALFKHVMSTDDDTDDEGWRQDPRG